MRYKTKVCPTCGQEMFDDAHQCFHCLSVYPSRRFAVTEKPGTTSHTQRQIHSMSASDFRSATQVGADALLQRVPTPSPSSLKAASQEIPDRPTVQAVGAHLAKPQFQIKVTVTDGSSQSYPLTQEGLKVGRSAVNDIVLNDETVSRDHVRFYLVGNQPMVEDRNPLNPTYIDGVRLKGCRELEEGARVDVRGTYFLLISN